MDQHKIETIKKLIEEDELEEALAELKKGLSGNKRYADTVTLLTSRYNSIVCDYNKGIISYEAKRVEKANIIFALLDILNKTVAVGYLVYGIKEDKGLNKFSNDFLGAFVRWVSPVFLKDDKTEKDALTDLKANPDDKHNQKVAQALIEKYLDKHPDQEQVLTNLLKSLQENKVAPGVQQINFSLGDNIHIGSIGGDYVKGDKITGNKNGY